MRKILKTTTKGATNSTGLVNNLYVVRLIRTIEISNESRSCEWVVTRKRTLLYTVTLDRNYRRMPPNIFNLNMPKTGTHRGLC